MNKRKWSHKFTAARPYTGTEYRLGSVIIVEAGLHQIGAQRPYFSVTGSIKEPRQREFSAAGVIHDDILAHWPELAPVVRLHLSDDVGTPMHAEANGWYMLAGYFGGAGEKYHAGNGMRHFGTEYRLPTADECLASFAEHMRITVDEARVFAKDLRDRTPDLLRLGGRALMATWIEEQAPRWKAEADAAVAVLDSLIG